MNPKLPYKLQTKIIIGVILLQSILSFFLIYGNFSKHDEFLKQSFIQEAHTLTKTLALNANRPYLSNDYGDLSDLMQSYKSNKNIDLLFVSMLDGLIVSSSNNKYIRQILHDEYSQAVITFYKQGNRSAYSAFHHQGIDVAYPLIANNEVIGFCRTIYSLKEYKMAQREIVLQSLFTALLALIITVIIAKISVRHLIDELTIITRAAQKIKEGIFTVSLEGKLHSQETALVGEAYEAMRQTIGDKIEKLEASQEEIYTLYQHEKKLKEIIVCVAQINQLLITSTNANELLQESIKELVRLRHYRHCAILLHNSRNNDYIAYHEGALPLTHTIEVYFLERFEEAKKNQSLTLISRLSLYSEEEGTLAFIPLKSDKNGQLLGYLLVLSDLSIDQFYDEQTMLDELAGDIGFAYAAFERQQELSILQEKHIHSHKEMIETLVSMIEERDSYTAGHTRRVALYCEAIAKELDFSSEAMKYLKEAAILHDVGKIVTPDSILLKPGKLSAIEYDLIKLHAISGYEMLHKVESYKEVAEIMRYHHEKYDGSGYPSGKKGEEIPLMAHIMIVADCYDAMTTNRIYKPKKGKEEALRELSSLSGTWYHPDVVEAALRVLPTMIIGESTSQLPQTILDKERFSYFFRDQLTGLYNENYLEMIMSGAMNTLHPRWALHVELHNFSLINQNESWKRGNDLLCSFAEYLKDVTGSEYIFRVKGDDFTVLFVDDEVQYEYDTLYNAPMFKETPVTVTYKKVSLL